MNIDIYYSSVNLKIITSATYLIFIVELHVLKRIRFVKYHQKLLKI